MREQLFRRRKLDNMTSVHHRYTVGEIFYNRQVVRDEQNCKPQLSPQIIKQIYHLRLDRYVERGDRFVGDNQTGVHYNRPRHTNTLTLSARKFVRIPSCVFSDQADAF